MLVEVQMHKDKGGADTGDFSIQHTILSHLSSLFPSHWGIFLCTHMCWLLPDKLILLMQILWLLVPFHSLHGGCNLF